MIAAAKVKLWAAQGFGVGLFPIGPGTAGSVLGLGWFALLASFSQPWLFVIGTALGLAASVWLCDFAEKILDRKDPGSVVLDEVAAMPVCFLAWSIILACRNHSWPGPANFIFHRNWLGTLAVFAAFRLFDVLKPWPIRQSQALPGGWGITLDDLLAACYVNLVLLAFYVIRLA